MSLTLNEATASGVKGFSGGDVFIKGKSIRYIHMTRVDPFEAVQANVKRMTQQSQSMGQQGSRVKGDGGRSVLGEEEER